MPVDAQDPVVAARIAHALVAHERGWALTPLNGKAPTTKRWNSAPPPTAETVRRWAEAGNVGLRCGRVSGVVVLDVDPQRGGKPPEDLPPGPVVVTGSGGLHVYFAYPDDGAPVPQSKDRLAPGVEVKSDGGQVVFVGSTHPETKRSYEWREGTDALPLPPLPAELLARIRESAPAPAAPRAAPHVADENKVARARAYLAKVPPAVSGQHGHDQTFKAACSIVEGFDLDTDAAYALLSEWNQACQPPWSEKELRHKIEDADKKATRRGHLLEATPTARGPGASSAAPPGRPVIRCGTDLHGNTCEAEAALAGLDEPRVYVRARGLVVVAREGAKKIRGVKRDPGAPFVHELTPAALREHLSRAASWARWNPKQQDWIPSLPSGPVVAALAARGSWPSLHPLAGVVEAPVFKPDGSVLDTPGYDEQTALLFAPRGVEFPPVPLAPTTDDVRAAVAALWEPLDQFEWENPEWDRPVIVALALTFAARPAFEGAAPCFVFDSTTRGSGKGLACATAVVGATGRRPPVSILSPEPEEQRKALFTLALEGHRAILLDNVTRPLGGAVLSACVTAGEIRDRVLGASRSAAAPFDAVLLATGNNVRYVDDFDRRVLVARQVPTVERPEERQPPGGFRHPDLLAYAQAEHPRLLSAALTLLRAYHVAGRPGHGLSPLGSFEPWDALVRGACLWAEVGDPLSCRERVESVDEDRERLAALIEAWHGAFGSAPTTVAKAASQAATDEQLRLALTAFDAKGDPAHLNAFSIGRRIRAFTGRIVGGRRLERVGKASPAVYRVGIVGIVGIDTADSNTRARAHARNGIGGEEPHDPHDPRSDPAEEAEREAVREEACGLLWPRCPICGRDDRPEGMAAGCRVCREYLDATGGGRERGVL